MYKNEVVGKGMHKSNLTVCKPILFCSFKHIIDIDIYKIKNKSN